VVTLTNAAIDGQGRDINDGVDVVGGQLALLGGVSIKSHGYHGVYVLGGAIYLENPTIANNWASGLRNDDGGTASLTVDGGVIGPDNGESAKGATWSEVAMREAAELTLIGTTVHDNPATGSSWGIELVGTGGYSLTNCDITGNAGGGIHFGGPNPATLTAFSGNKIHGNGGNQVFVSTGKWDLNGAGGCDGGENEIYCYASGYVGLAVDGGAAIVTASDDAWQDATPATGTDYWGIALPPTGSCPAVTSSCP
jgi:hypothetical protein